MKFKVEDTYQKVEKITTNFEPSDNEDVVSKAYLDKTLSEVNGHISYLEKIFEESNSGKLSEGEVLIEKAMKTTKLILYDERLFQKYDNADEIFKKIAS